jgi:hypothetical protein
MITCPLLTELWISALCCAVNGVPGYVHADLVNELAARTDRRGLAAA